MKLDSKVRATRGGEIAASVPDNREPVFFPKVLIHGNQVPHLGSPSAIVLYRLFENWPANRLLAIGPEYHAEATRLRCRYETWNDP